MKLFSRPGIRSLPATASQRRTWRRVRLGLVISAILVLVTTVSGIAFGYQVLHGSLPQNSGDLQVAGLTAPVAIATDTHGFVYVSATADTLAAGEHDALFAQGYVTARDRLFQMVLLRAVARGELAALLGDDPTHYAITSDRLSRALDLGPAADMEYARTSGAERSDLDAYAAGVNAFIRYGPLPPEFTILQVTPAPWKPADSLAIGRMMWWNLSEPLDSLLAAQIATQRSPALVDTFLPPYPADHPTIMPVSAQGSTAATAATATNTVSYANAWTQLDTHTRALLAGAALPTSSLTLAPDTQFQAAMRALRSRAGSNSIVVDGSRSATGKPLGAFDPHLLVNIAPSYLYLTAVQFAGVSARGASLVGLPGILIGQNNHVAWTITVAMGATADMRLVELSADGSAWLSPTGMQRVHVGATQQIAVNGGPSVSFTPRWLRLPVGTVQTIDAPLLAGLVFPTNTGGGVSVDTSTSLAIEWPGTDGVNAIGGLLMAWRTQNFAEFCAALDAIAMPLNFSYLDDLGAAGHIGYRLTGVYPERSWINELFPTPVSQTDYDWRGYVAQADLPRLYDPPSHQIVTANNQVMAEQADATLLITHLPDAGYRAARLTSLLAQHPARLTLDDLQVLMNDIHSDVADRLAPAFVAASQQPGCSDACGRMGALLGAWDHEVAATSVGATVYEVATAHLLHQALMGALGTSLGTTYLALGSGSNTSPMVVLLHAVVQPAAPFWSISPDASPATAQQARDHALQQALNDTAVWLTQQLGDDATQWTWGRLHQVYYTHPLTQGADSPMTQFLQDLFGIPPEAVPGDGFTVRVGSIEGANVGLDFSVDYAPALLMLVDAAHWDATRAITPLGQSGHPLSPHYDDLAAIWAAGRTLPFPPSAAGGEVLTLRP